MFLAFILVFSIVITSEFEGGLIRAVITGLIVSQVLLILNDGILHNVVDPGLHFFQQILFNLVNVQVVVFLVMRWITTVDSVFFCRSYHICGLSTHHYHTAIICFRFFSRCFCKLLFCCRGSISIFFNCFFNNLLLLNLFERFFFLFLFGWEIIRCSTTIIIIPNFILTIISSHFTNLPHFISALINSSCSTHFDLSCITLFFELLFKTLFLIHHSFWLNFIWRHSSTKFVVVELLFLIFVLNQFRQIFTHSLFKRLIKFEFQGRFH